MAEAEVVIRHTDDDGLVRTMYLTLELDSSYHSIAFDTTPVYQEDDFGFGRIYREVLYTEVGIRMTAKGKPLNPEGQFAIMWEEDDALAE